jgi:hypothetical protein
MTEEKVREVRRLVREGMSQEIVRREVLKEGTVSNESTANGPARGGMRSRGVLQQGRDRDLRGANSGQIGRLWAI